MKRFWSNNDIKTLRERYADTGNVELADLLGRSRKSVEQRAFKMGLKKSDEFMAQTGFQSGYTPFNKGRRMEEWLSPAVHAKIRANQARTGERNRTAALPDGTVRDRHDGRHVKIAGRWVKLSHHVWAQHNGPVPEGIAVFHLDGNCWNDKPENLYLDVPNDVQAVLRRKSPEERAAICRKSGATRRRKANEKYAALDAMLAEIRKSNNNINYKPKI